MERMYFDPETGEFHDERWFIRENIDLATVIEAIGGDGMTGFLINPSNLNRMRIRHETAFEILIAFIDELHEQVEAASGEERDELRRVMVAAAQAVARNMMEKITEEAGGSVH